MRIYRSSLYIKFKYDLAARIAVFLPVHAATWSQLISCQIRFTIWRATIPTYQIRNIATGKLASPD